MSSPECPGLLEPQVQITVTYCLPGVVTMGHIFRWMASQAEGDCSKEGGKYCPEQGCLLQVLSPMAVIVSGKVNYFTP